MKLILFPISLISEFSSLIIEFSPTIHFVISPHSFVISSVLIIKLSSSVSHSIMFVSLISTSCLILLNNIVFLNRLKMLRIVSFRRRIFITNLNNSGIILVSYWGSNRCGKSIFCR